MELDWIQGLDIGVDGCEVVGICGGGGKLL